MFFNYLLSKNKKQDQINKLRKDAGGSGGKHPEFGNQNKIED